MADWRVSPAAVTPKTRPPLVTSWSPCLFGAGVEDGGAGGFGFGNAGDDVT